jgi:HAD superfamily hydrolase (TIGR01509 family)
MSIRFIYFDLGNVLLNFSHRQACEQMGAVSAVSADQVWEIVFASSLEQRFESGEISDQQFYEEYCTAIGSKPDYEALLLAGSDIFTVNAAMLPLLAQLKAAGYRLGILSNTCRAHWNHCIARRYSVVSSIFDCYALSFELLACKPEAKIYHRAAALADVEPHEIFFVDDLLANVQGAKQAGFEAVLYASVPQLAAALAEREIRCNY